MAGGFHVIIPVCSSRTLVSWMMAKSPSALQKRRRRRRDRGEGDCDSNSEMFEDTRRRQKTCVYLL